VEPLRGRLLVATPQLTDPNFSRSVVLLLDGGDEGAFGVVLNQASDIPVADAAEAWVDVASAPGVVFRGGPVGTDHVIGLGSSPERDAAIGWAPMFSGLAAVDLGAGPTDRPLGGLRIFVGYAGWGVGQLEHEIDEGSWFVVEADIAADVFGDRPDALWAEVLRRQRGRTAWFANCPEDLSTN